MNSVSLSLSWVVFFFVRDTKFAMLCITDADKADYERIHRCFHDRTSVRDMRTRLVASHPPCFLRSFALRVVHHILEHSDPKRLLDVTLPSEEHSKNVCITLCALTLLPYFMEQPSYDVPRMIPLVLAHRVCRVGLHHGLIDASSLLRTMMDVVVEHPSTRQASNARIVMVCDVLAIIVPLSSSEEFFDALFLLFARLFLTSHGRDRVCGLVRDTECFRHPLFCRSTKHVLKRLLHDRNLSDERGLVALLACYAETHPKATRWVRSSFWSRTVSEGFPNSCVPLVRALLSGPCKVPLRPAEETALMAKTGEWKVVQDVVRARKVCVTNAARDWFAFTTAHER